MKKMINLVILGFLGVSIFAVEISAQCVQCKPSRVRNGGLSCQSSSSGGGLECQSDGIACTIVGVCRAGIAQSIPDSEEQNTGVVQIDEAILREIAAKHPRFAIALSLAAKSGYAGKEGMRVYVVPVEFTKEDFAKWLEFKEAERSGKPLKDFGGFAQKLSEPNENASPVTYLVSTERATSSTATIKLDVEEAFSSDPAFSSLEVTLVRAKGTASEKGTWRVEKWQLR